MTEVVKVRDEADAIRYEVAGSTPARRVAAQADSAIQDMAGGSQGPLFSEVGMGDPRWSPAWKRMRVQCYERDKAKHAVCMHCGQPIDYDAKPSTTDDSYEPDHRVPIETHPEYALLPENVQPSHKKCNRARGSRAGINNLGKRTRNWGRGS